MRPRVLADGTLGEALAALGDVVADQPGHRVSEATALLDAEGIEVDAQWVLTDDPDLTSAAHVVRVGAPASNVGFTAATWRRGADPFVVVSWFGAERGPVELQARCGSQAPLTQSLAPGATGEVGVSLPLKCTELVTVRIEPGGGLALDDQVRLAPPAGRDLVAEVAHPSPVAQRALRRLIAAVDGLVESGGGEAADVVFADGGDDGAAWAIRFVGGNPRVTMTTFVADPFAPVLRGVPLRDLRWVGRADSAPEGPVVLWGWHGEAQVPLVWQSPTGWTLNVDVGASNLLRHEAFVVLMANLVEARAAEQAGVNRATLEVGDRLVVRRRPGEVGVVTLRGPRGQAWTMAEEASELVLAALPDPGTYVREGAGPDLPLVANLGDPEESDLSRRGPPSPVPTLRAQRRWVEGATTELTAPLGLLAGVLLIGTWAWLQREREWGE